MNHEEKQAMAYSMAEKALADALRKGVIAAEEGIDGLPYGEAADRLLLEGGASDARRDLAKILRAAEDLWWEEDD